MIESLLVDEIEAAAEFRGLVESKSENLQALMDAAALLSQAIQRRAYAEWINE